jgi:hypothetical protein
MIKLTILQQMRDQISLWEQISDSRATFLSCYLLMTENMLQAIESNQFHDSEWVYTFLNRFAEYYFEALSAYENQRLIAPNVWVIVHDAAQKDTTQVLQNLLLGINAHINYDLIFTLVDMLAPEWEQLSLLEKDQRQADHNHVNRIIADTIDSVQDQVIEKLVPRMDLVDKLMGPLDEWMISTLITHWRDEVWRQAVDLLESEDKDACEVRKKEIEQRTIKRANTILLEDGKVDLIGMM